MLYVGGMNPPRAFLLFLVFTVGALGCKTIPKTSMQTSIQSSETPWTIVYSDGSGNAFRFTHPGTNESMSVSYDPVTPMHSSSRSYSGGTPKQSTLTKGDAARLWGLINNMAAAKDQQTDTREKLTGALTVDTSTISLAFIMRPGPLLDEFQRFVAPFRGTHEPATGTQAAKAPVVTVVGMATIAKVGALLQTDNGPVWVNWSEWPEGALGQTVEVTGHWTSLHDLPVFISKQGDPPKTGIPVPPGTDLVEASARDVLIVESWRVVP